MQFAHNGSYKGSIPFGLIYFKISEDIPYPFFPGNIIPSFPASYRRGNEGRTRGEEEGS